MKAPAREDLDVIAHTIAERVARYLEKVGYLVRDAESSYLDYSPEEDDAMNNIVGASVTYRLAFGPNAGKKALTLQTVPTRDGQTKPNELVSKQSGFSLHAGVDCKSIQRKKLERLCRYITRPAIASERRLVFTFSYIVYFKFIAPELDNADHWWFGISPEGIGTLGMIFNFVVSLAVSRVTPMPPDHIRELVQKIRVPGRHNSMEM